MCVQKVVHLEKKKKSLKNIEPLINIDTFKISIKLDIYDEILNLYNHNSKKKNTYIINNCIKVKLVRANGKRYTHITVYGIKSYNLNKDSNTNKNIDILIKYIVNNIPIEKVILKKIDISLDYVLKPENILIYRTYTDTNNKYIKLFELDSDKSYKDYSLYLHDFKYYKANIFNIRDDVQSLGIPLFENLKNELRNEFDLHYKTNKKTDFSKYIKNKYYDLGLEFIKVENGNYYMYIPRNIYESINYKCIKDNYKDKRISFKPDTTKSHVVKYDKANKVLGKQKINLSTDLTRVEFVINFNKKTLITDTNQIHNIINKQLNKVYITNNKIEKKTVKAFEEIYNQDNLYDSRSKNKIIDIIDIFMNKFT